MLRKDADTTWCVLTGKQRISPTVWLVFAVALLGLAALVIVFGQASVRVVELSPGQDDDDVPITAPIRITFSTDMDEATVRDRFRIEPEVPGELEWEGRTLTFRPRGALSPGTNYVITLEAGAVSNRGRSLTEETRVSFTTRAPQLLYLGWADESGKVRQLFAAPLNGEAPRQLTGNATGVWDYGVHPEGLEIVYSVLREDGGSDLWRMDRDGGGKRVLLPCPEAACLNPAWSPDGTMLAYERRDIWAGAPDLDALAGRIWLLDVEEREERPLFDYDVALHSPAWSPGGERLAYISPMLPGIEVLDLVTGELQQYGNEWGGTPVWSPDGTALIVSELMLEDELLVVRLVRINLEPGELLDISGDEGLVKDVGPAWSPGGGWIAFGRQFLGEAAWTPGRQIWLVRPDGSEAYLLLDEPMGDFYALTWRADGAALAYARIDLSEGVQAVPDVSVWMFDLVERKPVLVAEEGVLPKWLP